MLERVLETEFMDGKPELKECSEDLGFIRPM